MAFRTDPRFAQPGLAVPATDEGLRSFMLSVYNYMGLGLAITGIVALAVASSPAIYVPIFTTPLKWVVMLAPLGFVMFLGARIQSMSTSAAQITFWLFAAVMGISMASIFLVFTGESIARVFFITAATFGAVSLYGYTTKRDLTGMGSFLFMGLIGIVIASLVNIFVGSSALQFAVSVIGVAGVHRPHRLGYAAAQERVSRRPADGRRACGQGCDHGCPEPVPELHQPVHDAAAALRQPAQLGCTPIIAC